MAQAADRKAGGCDEQEPSGAPASGEDLGARWWRWAIASAARDEREGPGGAT